MKAKKRRRKSILLRKHPTHLTHNAATRFPGQGDDSVPKCGSSCFESNQPCLLMSLHTFVCTIVDLEPGKARKEQNTPRYDLFGAQSHAHCRHFQQPDLQSLFFGPSHNPPTLGLCCTHHNLKLMETYHKVMREKCTTNMCHKVTLRNITHTPGTPLTGGIRTQKSSDETIRYMSSTHRVKNLQDARQDAQSHLLKRTAF